MAAFGQNNNLSHGPQNHAQNRPPYNSNRKEVACRLCDRVLNSTQALISHIESHIVHGEIAPIRQNQQYHNHHHQPNPMMFQPNNHFFFPNPNNLASRFAPPPPPTPPPPPSQAKLQHPNMFLPSGGMAGRVVLQRPVPSRGPNLSLTLGGGAAGRAHSVKINLCHPLIGPLRVLSPDPDKKRGSLGRLAKRPRRNTTEAEAVEEVSPSDGTRRFLSQLDHPIPRVVDLETEYEHGLDLTLKL